jgi:hypothetical protein
MCSSELMQMIQGFVSVPSSLQEAANALRLLLAKRSMLPQVPTSEFVAGWGAIAYIAPGLHPDEADNEEGGWPVGWRCIASEAFRRCENGELSDNELYPYECSMAGLMLPD